MSSPVFAHYSSFIQIDRDSITAVYLQIASQLINAIQRGFIQPAAKLPGSRQLSELLDVHRNTVVAAFNELDAQGWVEVRPNQGTFVISSPAIKSQKISRSEFQNPAHYPSGTGYEFQASTLLDSLEEVSNLNLLANDGLPDIRLSQNDQLSKWYSAGLKRNSKTSRLNILNQEGNTFFKTQLSNYLNLTRGLHVSKDNILVTRSVEMSIYLVSQVLIAPGDHVIVGDLSYYISNMIFQKAGAQISSVHMDEDGIDVDRVRELCEQKKIRLLYLTPHHHYPTTVSLSAERRIQLLNLAEQYGFIILEDDYDYDFHFSNTKILPLASADASGMVVYIGAFGKSLAPGFRRGFVIAPENLIQELNKLQRIMDRQADVFMEYVLGELIDEGEIHRFAKKNIKIYKARRDNLAELFKDQLPDKMEFNLPSGGLAFWTKWDKSINLLRMSKTCAGHGLFIPQSLLYQTQQVTAMRLGFGHLNFEEQEKMVAVLKKSISS